MPDPFNFLIFLDFSKNSNKNILTMNTKIKNKVFKVGDTTYCLWDLDVKNRNTEFINNLDEGFFEYQANIHFSNLESQDKMRAAIALRQLYYHGMEVLFSLICASLQAPDCIYAWMAKYKVVDLQHILKDLNNNHSKFFQKLKISKPLSWDTYALAVFNNLGRDDTYRQETAKLFANFWQRLSHDFLDKDASNEYNGIKHGIRIRSGGFTMAFGKEEQFGQKVPPENMKILGGSEFGSSFYIPEIIYGCNLNNTSRNFRMTPINVNWYADGLAYALILIAMSLKNVKAFLKIVNGVSPESVEFTRPADLDFFDKPWEKSVGITRASFERVVDLSSVRMPTKHEIEKHIQMVEKKGKP